MSNWKNRRARNFRLSIPYTDWKVDRDKGTGPSGGCAIAVVKSRLSQNFFSPPRYGGGKELGERFRPKTSCYVILSEGPLARCVLAASEWCTIQRNVHEGHCITGPMIYPLQHNLETPRQAYNTEQLSSVPLGPPDCCTTNVARLHTSSIRLEAPQVARCVIRARLRYSVRGRTSLTSDYCMISGA